MKQTPVLLLTGYLGSGKTTLVNRILANKRNIKFAVIVNDIGEVNIDADLIQKGGVVTQGDDRVRLYRDRGKRYLRAGAYRTDHLLNSADGTGVHRARHSTP